jgi:putative transposase
MSRNNRRRWTAPWKDSRKKPAIYHCISRVVDRRFAFEADEREHFRMLMRMCEKFTGCRVLSYCVMSNHFHLLLEVPPMPEGGITDKELFTRLQAFYPEAKVAEIAKEMQEAEDAAIVRKRGGGELAPQDEPGLDKSGVPMTAARETTLAKEKENAAARRVEEIRARYTRRMHDLSGFMKSLLERYTKWFNRTHERSGTLWEDRFKSVIVESGVAARTIAAYIDLNPVRAGMVKDPAEYRWSSYGEAVGGRVKGCRLTRLGTMGNGKKAREGLVRACMSHEGGGFEAEKWRDVSRIYRRAMGLALGRGSGRADGQASQRRSQTAAAVTKNREEMLASGDNETALPDLGMAGMLRYRVRYFTDGAVIGGRAFVNEAFAGARERFGPKRKDGARRLRGAGAAAAETLWSMRDLRVRV